MEGILHRALALVVSLYCNLFPPPDVPLSKHGNVHPQIPHTNISSGRNMFTRSTADRSDRDGDMSVGGWRTDEEERRRQTDRQKDRQTEVSDICWGQLTTPGWPGGVRGDRGQKGVDNSHKCCNGWYFEFNSLPWICTPGLIYCILPFYTEFSSYMLFWFSAVLSDKGWRWTF